MLFFSVFTVSLTIYPSIVLYLVLQLSTYLSICLAFPSIRLQYSLYYYSSPASSLTIPGVLSSFSPSSVHKFTSSLFRLRSSSFPHRLPPSLPPSGRLPLSLSPAALLLPLRLHAHYTHKFFIPRGNVISPQFLFSFAVRYIHNLDHCVLPVALN